MPGNLEIEMNLSGRQPTGKVLNDGLTNLSFTAQN